MLITEGTKINSRVKYILLTSVVAVSAILSVWLIITFRDQIADLEHFGYLGVFVIAFIAGCSIPTPISYLLVTFTMGGILNPALVGLSAGLGAGIGGTLVFLLGRGGRIFLPGLKDLSADGHAHKSISSNLMVKFNQWAQKRGSIVVFLMSAMLNPVFAPMAIAMGALRFKAIKFFMLCTAGNLIKALVVSCVGFIGVGTLLRWLEGA